MAAPVPQGTPSAECHLLRVTQRCHEQLGLGLGALAPREAWGRQTAHWGLHVQPQSGWGGGAPGPAGQRAQGHLKAACAHRTGKGLRPLAGARRLACRGARAAWEGILDAQGIWCKLGALHSA